jgi:Spy/CpxP family protein refolding chaperone
MKSVLKPLLIAGLLATAGFAAFSKAPGGDECNGMMGAGGHMQEGGHHGHIGQRDPAKMQAGMNKRNAALKVALKLTPAQESAWTTYTAAMVPPAGMLAKHAEQADFSKLSTPELIDKIHALRAQHMAEMTAIMDKHGEATKTFYATLTPEQKKVFDANAMRPKGSRHHHMSDAHDGKGPMPTKQ